MQGIRSYFLKISSLESLVLDLSKKNIAKHVVLVYFKAHWRLLVVLFVVRCIASEMMIDRLEVVIVGVGCLEIMIRTARDDASSGSEAAERFGVMRLRRSLLRSSWRIGGSIWIQLEPEMKLRIAEKA